MTKHLNSLTKQLTFTIVFIWFLVLTVARGQQYTIRNIKINPNGESHNHRNFLQVDHEGFLWYSTYSGIVKDFGTQNVLSSFVGKNEKLLPKLIHGFFIDSRQRVWISADTGIFVSNEVLENSFNRIEFSPILQGPELQANSFIEGCDGNMWIIAANRSDNLILKVDSSFSITEYGVPEIEPRYTEDRYFQRNYLYFERIIDCNKILIRQGRKLFIFEEGKTSLITDLTDTVNYEKRRYLYPEWQWNGGDGLLITDNGDILPKSLQTVYIYNGEIFKTHFIKDWDIQVLNLPFQEMIPICKDRNPILKNYADVIGIDDFGKKVLLFKMIEVNGNFHLKKVLEIPFPNEIGDLVIDNNDVIHLSGYDQIYKIKFSKNNFSKILNDFEDRNMDIRGFSELSENEILVATNSGIFKLNQREGNNGFENSYETDKMFPSLNFLKSFVKTNDSTVWCLGDSKGLWEINFFKNKIEEIHIFHSHWKLANLYYNDILKYSDTTLLLAGLFGLQEFDMEQKEFREVPIPNIENNREILVLDIHKTEDKLYIATDTQGLVIKDLNFNTFLHLNSDLNNAGLTLPSNKINAICVDGQKNLWLGTAKGVVQIDKDLGSLKVINDANGLANLNVVGILEDAYENMWFSTLNGLYKYEKSSKRITAFFTEDGLISNEFNRFSYFKSSAGNLFFGGTNGLVTFDSITNTGQSQKIKIFPTKFQYYDTKKEKEMEQYILDKDRYTFDLPFNKNSFSVSYSINDCYNTDTNKYVYRLDGVTDGWVDLGNQTTLKLLSLSPGDYVLRIKGFNPTGVESSNELLYDIHVDQVFYKQIWFQILGMLIVVAIVCFLIFRHNAITKRRYSLNLALVELERKTLISQMNPHFIFNALNEIRNRLSKGKIRGLDNYVTLFSKLTRLTLDVTRNERIQLSKEIDFIKSYIALHNIDTEHGIDLIVKCECNIDGVVIPPMILQPVIENSIVHGFTKEHKEKRIILKIERLDSGLVFNVEDNGLGIISTLETSEHGHQQSYASQILQERLSLMNQISQRVEVYNVRYIDLSEEGRTGTRVIITIPYID